MSMINVLKKNQQKFKENIHINSKEERLKLLKENFNKSHQHWYKNMNFLSGASEKKIEISARKVQEM